MPHRNPVHSSQAYYDELRATSSTVQPDGTTKTIAAYAQLAGVWSLFMQLEGLQIASGTGPSAADSARLNAAQSQLLAPINGLVRPGAQDLLPLIISAASWQQIEAGVQQRLRLLEAVLADVYGSQSLLAKGQLPAALVQGHPGYLRPLHGVVPLGGTRLLWAAFDLQRDAQGQWWLQAQHTEAPAGLGTVLDNRQALQTPFAQAYAQLPVRSLADAPASLLNGLRRRSGAGAQASIALLTSGPFNAAYSEHTSLARHLGLRLVQGGALQLRAQSLALRGAEGEPAGDPPVHALLQQMDDFFLDPLELRADSHLGVPGLLQALRAGNLLMANMPGSGFLESPGLLSFLPALAQSLLRQDLLLPALPTWWCGERAAMVQALPQLASSVIYPSYPSSEAPVWGSSLGPQALREWTSRILRNAPAYTLQAEPSAAQMPVWRAGQLGMRAYSLRVFAFAGEDTGQWTVLPGGLARVANTAQENAVAYPSSSADVWVLGTAPGTLSDALTGEKSNHSDTSGA